MIRIYFPNPNIIFGLARKSEAWTEVVHWVEALKWKYSGSILSMYFILHPYHVEPSHNATTGALVVLKVERCVIIDKLGSLNRLVHTYTSYGHFKLILKVKGELLLLEKVWNWNCRWRGWKPTNEKNNDCCILSFSGYLNFHEQFCQ